MLYELLDRYSPIKRGDALVTAQEMTKQASEPSQQLKEA